MIPGPWQPAGPPLQMAHLRVASDTPNFVEILQILWHYMGIWEIETNLTHSAVILLLCIGGCRQRINKFQPWFL